MGEITGGRQVMRVIVFVERGCSRENRQRVDDFGHDIVTAMTRFVEGIARWHSVPAVAGTSPVAGFVDSILLSLPPVNVLSHSRVGEGVIPHAVEADTNPKRKRGGNTSPRLRFGLV